MRCSLVLSVFAYLVTSVLANSPSPTVPSKRHNDDGFVTTVGNRFFLDGKSFNFVGTDAYWLPMLNSTDDVETTLQSINATHVSVVRLWAFNDVVEIPPNNATYFQLFQNGTATINTGPNGLQRLDNVIKVAKSLGLKVLLTTTNNWNPQDTNGTAGLPNGKLAPTKFPHGFLSNDYGGMDLYVRQIKGAAGRHDDFFDDAEVKNAYKAYLKVLISRYANETAVFGWELANDPRCNSTLPNKPSCNTTTVTGWHVEISQMIQQLDPNHIIASGAQGFLCQPELGNCPKLFPLAPPPQTSSTPAQRKRSVAFSLRTIRDITTATRKRRSVEARGSEVGGRMIRGRWAASATKRQVPQDFGSAFDGSFGVDSQDILNIPQIGFSTFQLFPDQNVYFLPDPNVNALQNVVEEGINWIQTQAQAAQQVGKPVILTAFGLVSQNNSQFFVPFNATEVVTQNSTVTKGGLISGLTDSQQATVYSQWSTAALQAGIDGLLQYQWSQPGLSQQGGGGVVTTTPDLTGTTAPVSGGGVSSPNDGYGAQQGSGPGTLIGSILNQTAGLFAA